MKKIVSVTEVDGEGLEALMGENVLLFCMNYIYTGKLVGVNKTCVLLENARLEVKRIAIGLGLGLGLGLDK